MLLVVTNSARDVDTDGYRAEFVTLVRMTESLGKVGQHQQSSGGKYWSKLSASRRAS